MSPRTAVDHSIIMALLTLLLTLVSTCSALRVVYDSHLRNCPCTIDLQLRVARSAPVSVQVATEQSYKHWKASGKVNSIVQKLNTLPPGTYNVKHRVPQSGRYAVIVHGTNQVSVVGNVQPRREIEPTCRLSLTFRTKLWTSARNERLLPVSERIINGALAKGAVAKQLTYTVLLRYRKNVCTGSVIAPRWVLTAAHCHQEEGTKVYLRYKSKIYRKATAVYRHPQYSFTRHVKYNDVALLRLDAPLYVTPLKLYNGDSSKLVGRFARESGFGREVKYRRTDQRLRVADTPVISTTTCKSKLLKRFKRRPAELLNSYHHLCTDSRACGVSACSGDSGSPLCVPGVHGEHVQVGLLSYSVGGCAITPDVYMNIASHASWIRSKTGGAVKFTNKI